MCERIVIGISASRRAVATNFSSKQEVVLLAQDYFNLFKGKGVVPLILSENIETDCLDVVCDRIDALFLTGGEDIDPSFYGEEQEGACCADSVVSCSSSIFCSNPFRDRFEIALYNRAKEAGIPIFGNCRGMQIINVAEGGSLFQDISSSFSMDHLIDRDGWVQYHEISIASETLWGRLLDRRRYTASSCHHQSVNRLGEGLKVAARSSDGVIELIEHEDESRFILGMQGHIEKMTRNFDRYAVVLDAFIKQAIRAKGVTIWT